MPQPIYIGANPNPYGLQAMNYLQQLALQKMQHNMRMQEVQAQAKLAQAEKAKEATFQAQLAGSNVFRSDAQQPPAGYIQNPWDTTTYISRPQPNIQTLDLGNGNTAILQNGKLFNITKNATSKPPTTPSKMLYFELSKYGKEVPEMRGSPEYLSDQQQFMKDQAVSSSDINPMQIMNLRKAVANGQLSTKQIPKRGKVWSEVSSGVLEDYPKFDFTMNDANYNYRNNANILRSAGLVKASMPRVLDLYQKALNLKNSTNLPILDQKLNDIKKVIGNETVTDFESLRNAVLFEVNTALSGSSVPSDYRIKLEIEQLKSGLTLGQQIRTIGNLVQALQARGDASLLNAYPLDVVRGLKTMGQWREEQSQEVNSIRNLTFGIKTVRTQKEVDALPTGAQFIWADDNKQYRKQ